MKDAMNSAGCKALAMAVIVHGYKEFDYSFFRSPIYQFYASIAEVENIKVEDIHFNESDRKEIFETHSVEELTDILSMSWANIRKEAYRNGWQIGIRANNSLMKSVNGDVFWENVRLTCRRNGVRQRQLAEYLGMQTWTLKNYFHTKPHPRKQMTEKIAKFLNCSIEELTENEA